MVGKVGQMSERLDLSNIAPVGEFVVTSNVLYNRVLSEAIRAQRSEDALRERVRVLEEALRVIADGAHELSSGVSSGDDFWGIHRTAYEALTGGKEGV